MNTALQELKINRVINYADANNTTLSGTWLSLENYDKAVFVFEGFALSAPTGVSAIVVQATDTSGTSAKVISGKTSTFTASQTNVTIEVDADELDVANGFCAVSARVHATNKQAPVAVNCIRLQSRFPGASLPS